MSQEDVIELGKEMARLEADVKNLRSWQAKQNGSLQRIDDRLHSLERWIMATLATAVVSLLIQLALQILRR